MDSGTLVALTVLSGAMASLMGTVLAPVMLMWLTARERRREKLEDYSRQDQVSARTEQVAQQAAKTASLLIAQNAKVAQVAACAAADTNHKLDEIHTAVNSNLTKATQGELEAKEQSLILMVEIMELKRVAGTVPSTDVLKSIDVAKQRIAELKLALGPHLIDHIDAATTA